MFMSSCAYCSPVYNTWLDKILYIASKQSWRLVSRLSLYAAGESAFLFASGMISTLYRVPCSSELNSLARARAWDDVHVVAFFSIVASRRAMVNGSSTIRVVDLTRGLASSDSARLRIPSPLFVSLSFCPSFAEIFLLLASSLQFALE